MGFEAIRGQAEALEFIRGSLERQRIPSAFLFHGPGHVGKRTTALALAMALNCARGQGDGCGECPSCRKITESLHPDVDTVKPDGQYIKIDQVREVQERLSLIPYEARKRVIIFAQAERMNPQAANAFLKTLEEPPGDTLLILCAEQPTRLLETIRSRCVPVRFALLGPQVVRDLMIAGKELAPEVLDFAVRFSQGRVRPDLLENTPRWLEVRDAMIVLLEALHRPVFPQVSEHCARWAGSEEWVFVLEWLESWFRDLALLGDGVEESALINGDRITALRQASAHFHPPLATRCHQQVLDTREAIRVWNTNKTLALESLWLGFRHMN